MLCKFGMLCFHFEYLHVYCNKDETESVDVGISHTTTVCNIHVLCIHYELRSACTHGSVEKTLRYEALTNFQKTSDIKPISQVKREKCARQ